MDYKTSMRKPLPTVQINIPPGFVDLGRGDPQLALLPLDLLRQAADRRFSQGDNAFLQYGTEQGDGYLRAALADFLGDPDGTSTDPDTLFITAGISSALDLLCTVFTRWGDTVFVEEPSYFLALQIFADHGLHVVSIPTDGSGLIIEALEDALREHQPKFLYIIPVFQNPSGHTLTQERRERLVSLSRQHNFLLLADEVYQNLNYTVQPPACFGAYREFENVISLGSFSKILAPGLRLGWMQADARIVQRLTGCGLLTSGGGMNPFTSAVVCGLIENGDLKKNIARLVQVYSARAKAMDEALRRHLPEAEFVMPQGGYFFWVRLPGLDAETLRKEAQPLQVDFRPGILFSSQGGLRDYLRLSISYYDGEDIELGLQRLEQSLRQN
jgi:DNA-binding transcriptional MocR family regulator